MALHCNLVYIYDKIYHDLRAGYCIELNNEYNFFRNNTNRNKLWKITNKIFSHFYKVKTLHVYKTIVYKMYTCKFFH